MLVGLMLAGCGGQTTRQPAPETRVQQPRQEAPAPVEDSRPVLSPLPDRAPEDEKVRIALLLPLSGDQASTGQALLNAASMALFEAYDPRLVLLPFDTAGERDRTREQALNALNAGADLIIGPLFANNVVAADEMVAARGIPVIGLSNDRSIAAPGRYVFGFAPEQEVARVVRYAVERGHERFAALIPAGRYGDQVERAFTMAVNRAGAEVARLQDYPPMAEAVSDPIRRLTAYDSRQAELRAERQALEALNSGLVDPILEDLADREVLGPPPFDAVLIPEGGALLRTMAALLPYFEVDPEQVRFLGTGLWQDDVVLGETTLQGGLFAAPDPGPGNRLLARYKELFSGSPPRIASLAYDAVALAAHLVRTHGPEDPFSEERLTVPGGFAGVDGPFRFLETGVVDRNLAVIAIEDGAFTVAAPAPGVFRAPLVAPGDPIPDGEDAAR
ncbi:penicillin-binding protein activator [Yunchengibacter salinarum]|uniref:penicillin-binding protein activator n=1 Tax=Yunchengibacter salinarum TaxID=3133399 RepID=UPI0035B629A0